MARAEQTTLLHGAMTAPKESGWSFQTRAACVCDAPSPRPPRALDCVWPRFDLYALLRSLPSQFVFIMPESHKAEKRRLQKANRAEGIGDENGRIMRVKDEKPKGKCTVCNQEITFTKTNTEAKAHAEGKHGSTIAIW